MFSVADNRTYSDLTGKVLLKGSRQTSKCKIQNYETPRKKNKKNSLRPWVRQGFLKTKAQIDHKRRKLMNLTSPKFKMSAFDNTVMKMKRQATDWEKIFATCISHKRLVTR